MSEWIKTSAVMGILRDGSVTNNWSALAGLPTKKGGRVTGGYGKATNLYRLSDVERIRRLMVEAKLTLPSAVRVVIAQNEGRI